MIFMPPASEMLKPAITTPFWLRDGHDAFAAPRVNPAPVCGVDTVGQALQAAAHRIEAD
jgi:hypothetical protein